MSNLNVVFACIHEALPTYRKADPEFFRRANDAAIRNISIDDTWPPLVRAMVSTTGDDSLHGSGKNQRLISIVGHFNGIEVDGILPWLDKLETLLRRLFWIRADVYSFGGWEGGRCRFEYRAPKDTIIAYSGEQPAPPSQWRLRCLELPNSTDTAQVAFLPDLLDRPGFTTDPD